MPQRRPIVGGNWKMNTDLASARALARAVADAAAAIPARQRPEVVVFPPFPYLLPVGGVLRDHPAAGERAVTLGAQDVFFSRNGAFTGEVSVEMLLDCGVSFVLAGHSERRHVIGESDEVVNAKVRAVLDAPGLSCILCIGETLEQREAGQTDQVNERQLRAGLAGVSPPQVARVVIAYEPVWAIGTGRTATPADAQAAHARIRGVLGGLFGSAAAAATRIQYGGSVKAANAADLLAMPDVDGFLVGGASLDADEFGRIVRAAAPGS
jgi:triosephosphate isomerase